LYSGEFGGALEATEMEESPAVAIRATEMNSLVVGCMVGSSVDVWQEMQPEDLRSASSCD